MTHTIYRVEHINDGHGLWYNADGTYNGFIHNKMVNASLAELPMGFDPEMVRDNLPWISAADSIEQLRNWVSREDAEQLQAAGFEFTTYDVTSFRRVPGHVVFLRKDVIDYRSLPFTVLYK